LKALALLANTTRPSVDVVYLRVGHLSRFRSLSSAKPCRARWFFIALVVSACILTFCRSWAVELIPERPFVLTRSETRDFVEYWAAARLFAQGNNPYSPAALLELERSAGWSGAQPLIMWNPPWILPLLLPFGLLPFTTSQFLWLLVHVCLLLISAQCLWRIYNTTAESVWPSWLVALTFVPTVFVLIIGQITPIVLAGAAWFLYSLRQHNYFTMSAALAVFSLKPHLLYLFWIVLMLWIWDKRLWRLASSALVLGLIVALLPLLLDPQIYLKYFALYDIADIIKPLEWPAPTLRNVLRIFLAVDRQWLQFAPTVMAVCWAVYHWYSHKHGWRWDEQLPLLSLVSVASGFFVWTYDHVVLLPAVIEAAAWISRSPAPWHRCWAVRLYLAINAAHFLLRFWLPVELWYFWLAPALLINYLIFHWERSFRSSRDGALNRRE
jgi:hypothetical protein